MPINTATLKRFAQATRTQLLEEVTNRLSQIQLSDGIEQREKASQITSLNEELQRIGKDALIDKIAYTWFNRLIAFRYMDANGYTETGIVSGPDGTPQILKDAQAGIIDDDLRVDGSRIKDLLLGNIPSDNAQNEVYKLLLVAECNRWHNTMPFIFQSIDDYTELLLPQDMLTGQSIRAAVAAGLSVEDCEDVEIIGWLYQFYISERKDEVFASKGKVSAADIPAATQLFTPRWIVEYMVQNTVGKLWLQNKPNSGLRAHMPYYIESPSSESEDFLKVNSVEELTLLDQACGSGHILVYGFDLLSKIYEEELYNESEIPQLIIENNLFGFEIDERAAQLAGLALMMKARSYHRRVFRKKLQPNILQYKDLRLTDEDIESFCVLAKIDLTDKLAFDLSCTQQVTNLGSLILPHNSPEALELYKSQIASFTPGSNAFVQFQQKELLQALDQLLLLSKKYHCIVDNPPYMGGGNMNKPLSDFVKKNYPHSKADLMACFMEAGISMLLDKGFLGMINQHSWMFLGSYEKLREKLLMNIHFDTMLHLGPRTFPEIGGEVVQNTSFTIAKSISNSSGAYLRLVDLDSTFLKRDKTKEVIRSSDSNRLYYTDQSEMKIIPGFSFGYWLDSKILNQFSNKKVGNFADTRSGMSTSDNKRFLRIWSEISAFRVNKEDEKIDKKWVFIQRGGGFRRWYGLATDVINWENNGYEIKEYASKLYGSYSRTIKSLSHIFREGITWSYITSGKFSARKFYKGTIFINAGPAAFLNEVKDEIELLGYLNCKITDVYLKLLSPTLNYDAGPVSKIPYNPSESLKLKQIVEASLQLSKNEWDSSEKSWDFAKNELVKTSAQDLQESINLYQQYWTNKFYQLHRNEEELNKHFIEIYGLQEELTPDVALSDITILKEELDQKKLKDISERYHSGWKLKNQKEWVLPSKADNPELPFDLKEIKVQFISYSVGCMMGRYSLDKEGLVLANQGETLQDYIDKVSKSESEVLFLPDDDAIIPILDDKWFEDDIVRRFYEFLKASFSPETFEENLRFLEGQIGKDVRKWFVKDFYKDHIKRYKKRPIYWLFSSPKGHFSVLIYMHRYTPDMVSTILHDYLKPFVAKLEAHERNLDNQLMTAGLTASEKNKLEKKKKTTREAILDCLDYERDTLLDIAQRRIEIDLDDGVLVNYNKFGKAVKTVPGLNDAKAKKKVRGFDWIDTSLILD